jgi:hypothetical protein
MGLMIGFPKDGRKAEGRNKVAEKWMYLLSRTRLNISTQKEFSTGSKDVPRRLIARLEGTRS